MTSLTGSQPNEEEVQAEGSGLLDKNRKLKYSLMVTAMALVLFVIPETISAFTEFDYHLLDSAGFITLVGLAIGVFTAGNVAAKFTH